MNATARRFGFVAAIFALLAVALGALGAHALKSYLEPAQLASFEVAVRYQMYHALALLILALLIARAPSRGLTAAGCLISTGTILFSGSIYLLVTLHWRWLGPVTPIGGVCFMAGWLTLGISLLRSRS